MRLSHSPDEYDLGFHVARLMKKLGVVKASPSGGLRAEASESLYVEDGADVELRRGKRVLARGVVGPLPPTEASITLRPGDAPILTADPRPARPPPRDAQGLPGAGAPSSVSRRTLPRLPPKSCAGVISCRSPEVR